MSDMIAELWDVTVEVGAMSKSDASQMVSLERHLKLRQKLLDENKVRQTMDAGKESGPSTSASFTHSKPDSANKYLNKDEKGENAVTGKLTQPNEQLDELSYDGITERVKALVENVKKRTRPELRGDVQAPRQVGRATKLTPSQSIATVHVKTLWDDNTAAGAVLNGSTCSGKTIAVCSLLCSHRREGPQLLICPPARVVSVRSA